MRIRRRRRKLLQSVQTNQKFIDILPQTGCFTNNLIKTISKSLGQGIRTLTIDKNLWFHQQEEMLC